MYPDAIGRQQSGAGLPVAIFIITVLALIVFGMAQLQESSGQSISLQIQSQRAFYAAESGAQVAVVEALDAGGCSAVSTPKSFTGSGLNGCRAVLSCESVTAELNGASPAETIFTIESLGQCGAGVDAAQRVVEVRVR